MSRHLHSRTLSRNIACVSSPTPEPPSTWGLPTPPPSLSDLSSLARPEYPGVNHLGGDQSLGTRESPQHISRDQLVSNDVLLPLHVSSHLNSIEPRALVWPGPWLNYIASFRRTAARSLRRRWTAGNARHRFDGLGTNIGAWLTLYLACNLALTLHNKYLLNDFPFPWILTALHAFCSALGSWICARRGIFKPAPINHPTTPLLALFSILYSANIAASNASLRLVSIATHQVVRAATPLFVILFAWVGQIRVNTAGLRFHRNKLASGRQGTEYMGVSREKFKSLIPVVLGVVFATYGDYSYTCTGVLITLVGTALAALKALLTSRVVRPKTHVFSLLYAEPTRLSNSPQMKRHESKRTIDEGYLSSDENVLPGLAKPASAQPLHPLDVLLRLSPLACVQCLAVAFISGETDRWSTPTLSEWRALALNGVLAFLLNYVSFVTNRRAGALSMTVAANVKQVLTILLALVIFNTGTPSAMHLLGIGLTLCGGAWYGYLEVQEKSQVEGDKTSA